MSRAELTISPTAPSPPYNPCHPNSWDEDTDDWEWTTIGVPAVEKNYETIIGGFAQGNYSTHGTIVLSHEL